MAPRKDVEAWLAKTEAQRTKSIPSLKAVRLYRAGYGADVYQTLLVLADAKVEKLKGAPMRELQGQLTDHTWGMLRRRTLGVWYPDEFAEDLNLPTYERIEEVNEQYIWETASAASTDTDSQAFQDAESEVQGELYRQWKGAIEAAATTVAEIIACTVVTRNADAGELVVMEQAGWDAAAMHGFNGQDWPERGHESLKEYVLFYFDEQMPAFSKADIRRVYDRAF